MPSAATSEDREAVVAFRGVTFRPPGAPRDVLGGLDLSIYRGETLILLGPSGCGKTTALRLINRLLLPTSGTVSVNGRDTATWDPIELRRGIGYVIQDAGLFPHFTVFDNVAVVPRLLGWEPARVRSRVEELLALVGLAPDSFAGRLPHELSGGQRQRVGVARALAADPPVLLLDEPFGALDPLTRASIQREFRSLQKRLGKTAVFVTHDVREALILGTRIALLDAGHVAVLETPRGFQNSQAPLARAYLDTLVLDENLGSDAGPDRGPDRRPDHGTNPAAP